MDGAIYLFFALFAVLLPHSIKGAQHAWQLAFLAWLVKLAVERKRPFQQPLAASLLAYITLSAISTVLSPDPFLSWDRMKIVCLVLVGIVFAQNLHRLTQVRTLMVLLILSGVAAAGFTAWQYSYGVGAQVTHIDKGSPLYHAGLRQDDIITSVNNRPISTPEKLEEAGRSGPDGLLQVSFYRVLRFEPFRKREVIVSRDELLRSGLGTPALQLRRGKPFRAQGTLGHYVIFAEMLMQISCLTWALLLSVPASKRRWQVLLAVALVALTAAILATETRSVVAGLAVGCAAALLVLTEKRTRLWASAALLLLVISAGLWMSHARGAHWIDARDPGTNFRLLMWEDGLRLLHQHPWFGIGMETARNHWGEWNIRAFRLYHVQSHFHSDTIQIAVERGLPALGAWLWFVVAYFLFLLRLLRKARAHSRFATGVVAGILAAFIAWQTTALVHYNLGEESLVMILFFYFGVAVALDRILTEKEAIDVA